MLEVGEKMGKVQDRNAMKAWLIRDSKGTYDFATVVFAETRNKAKVLGMNSDAYYGAELDYTDVNATRIPALDKYYKGNDEMDWENDNDRIAMVKDGNFHCFEDRECPNCPAKKYCDYCEDCEVES